MAASRLDGFPIRLGSLIFASVVLAGCGQPTSSAPPPPPPDVTVTKVVQHDEQIRQEWIGTLDGFVDADIRAQVSGYLIHQNYRDGAAVKKGDLLFEIDPRPFEAAESEAKANYERANADLERDKALVGTDAVPRSQYDTAVAAQLTAKAALQTADLNLGFTRITAPIDGLAGIARAQLGDLVGPSSGVLTTVSTVDPIKVYFSISEQSYLQLQRGGPDRPKFPEGLQLQLVLSDGSVYPKTGKFYATDRQVDPATGTLRVAGEFPNPDNLLRPGQYVRVRAVIRTAKDALEVPERAVSELQGASQIAVLQDQHKAHFVTVQLGDRVEGRWIVESGLKPTDTIIVDGLQKVREGSTVNPQPLP